MLERDNSDWRFQLRKEVFARRRLWSAMWHSLFGENGQHRVDRIKIFGI